MVTDPPSDDFRKNAFINPVTDITGFLEAGSLLLNKPYSYTPIFDTLNEVELQYRIIYNYKTLVSGCLLFFIGLYLYANHH